MFKVEVLNSSCNSNKKNDKKKKKSCMWVQRLAVSNKYYDHKSSFAHEIYRHKTTLSNYVWEVKNKFGIDPILKWEIVKRCSKYKSGGGIDIVNYVW